MHMGEGITRKGRPGGETRASRENGAVIFHGYLRTDNLKPTPKNREIRKNRNDQCASVNCRSDRSRPRNPP
jgi:hypothetical protein